MTFWWSWKIALRAFQERNCLELSLAHNGSDEFFCSCKQYKNILKQKLPGVVTELYENVSIILISKFAKDMYYFSRHQIKPINLPLKNRVSELLVFPSLRRLWEFYLCAKQSLMICNSVKVNYFLHPRQVNLFIIKLVAIKRQKKCTRYLQMAFCVHISAPVCLLWRIAICWR